MQCNAMQCNVVQWNVLYNALHCTVLQYNVIQSPFDPIPFRSVPFHATSGSPRQRIDASSSSPSSSQRGETAAPRSTSAFARASSAASWSAPSGSRVTRSSVVASGPRCHASVGASNSSSASAVSRCCAECWHIVSQRRAHSTTTSTSAPTASGLASVCTAIESRFASASSGAPPTVP